MSPFPPEAGPSRTRSSQVSPVHGSLLQVLEVLIPLNMALTTRPSVERTAEKAFCLDTRTVYLFIIAVKAAFQTNQFSCRNMQFQKHRTT